MAYSADGKQLVTGGGEESTVRLWDAASGKLLRTLTGHTRWVETAAFRSDGKHIASTGWDKTVRVWDAATGRALVSFKGHPEDINDLAYSPDGKRLATASEDKTIRIWDLEKILKDAAAGEKK